jgi:Ser/Thr protein kinase RdoA (MazF antagonist)
MPETFPVLLSKLSSTALARDVLLNFGIGPVAECRFFSGGFNHTYQVLAESGETYYFRAYRPMWRTLPDIRCELDALLHLHKKGFPAAWPLLYQDGEPYCEIQAPEGVRYGALFTLAPGKEISYDNEPEKVSYDYGRAVAAMHNAFEDFSSPHPRFRKDLLHLIDRPLANIKPFLARRPADWNYLTRFAETLRNRIAALPAESLEQGFCHGDLQGYHAKVNGDGTLTFFDFDCGGFGYRAYDLAVFLWCARLEDQVKERWEPFLRGYQEVRPLDPLEIEAAPLFVGGRYLWHMGVHTQNAPDWGIDFLNDGYFDRRIKVLKDYEADTLAGR